MSSQATSTVTASPELISILFNTLNPTFIIDCTDTKDLLQWMLVNKLWYSQGLRALWKKTHIVVPTITRPVFSVQRGQIKHSRTPDFLSLTVERQQRIASYIRHLVLGELVEVLRESPEPHRKMQYQLAMARTQMRLISLDVRGSSDFPSILAQSPRQLSLLCGSALQSLKIGGEPISSSFFTFIRDHTDRLHTLHLSFIPPVVPETLNILVNAIRTKRTLKEIRLDFDAGVQINPATELAIFKAIAEHPSLERILNFCTPDRIENVYGLTGEPLFSNLKELSLHSPRDAAVSLAKHWPKLANLTLSHLSPTSTFLAAFLGNPSSQDSLDAIPQIPLWSSVPKLETLILELDRTFSIGQEDLLAGLSRMTSLRQLTIRNLGYVANIDRVDLIDTLWQKLRNALNGEYGGLREAEVCCRSGLNLGSQWRTVVFHRQSTSHGISGTPTIGNGWVVKHDLRAEESYGSGEDPAAGLREDWVEDDEESELGSSDEETDDSSSAEEDRIRRHRISAFWGLNGVYEL